MPMARGNDQEYSGLPQRPQGVGASGSAPGDYATPVRTVTLVPPPMLTKLTRDEHRPAYLYHRALDGGPGALKGLAASPTWACR